MIDPQIPEDRTFRQITRDVVNHTMTPLFDDLQPWQAWYLKHVYCDGELKLIQGRKRTSLICTCEFVKEEDGTLPAPEGGSGQAG